MDLEGLMTYADNLIEILKDEKDIGGLSHFLRQSNSLQSQCGKDLNHVQISIQDYTKKIDACKKKIAATQSESVADAELSALHTELEEEEKLEQKLREELRVIINEIEDLERQTDTLEQQRQSIKKLEQDELRHQMKLSMYASVTNIIPCLDDQSKISGSIVEKDKRLVEMFEFDPSKASEFDTCNNVWKLIKF